MCTILALAGFADPGDNSEFERIAYVAMAFLLANLVLVIMLLPGIPHALRLFKMHPVRAMCILAIEGILWMPLVMFLVVLL